MNLHVNIPDTNSPTHSPSYSTNSPPHSAQLPLHRALHETNENDEGTEASSHDDVEKEIRSRAHNQKNIVEELLHHASVYSRTDKAISMLLGQAALKIQELNACHENLRSEQAKTKSS